LGVGLLSFQEGTLFHFLPKMSAFGADTTIQVTRQICPRRATSAMKMRAIVKDLSKFGLHRKPTPQAYQSLTHLASMLHNCLTTGAEWSAQ
jgi:hypothetical protein